MYYLQNYLGNKLPLSGSEVVRIGSTPECRLYLAGRGVKDFHAIVYPVGNYFKVESDRRGDGVVLVNGEEISGSRRLNIGDKIGIGEHDLEFRSDSDHYAICREERFWFRSMGGGFPLTSTVGELRSEKITERLLSCSQGTEEFCMQIASNLVEKYGAEGVVIFGKGDEDWEKLAACTPAQKLEIPPLENFTQNTHSASLYSYRDEKRNLCYFYFPFLTQDNLLGFLLAVFGKSRLDRLQPDLPALCSSLHNEVRPVLVQLLQKEESEQQLGRARMIQSYMIPQTFPHDLGIDIKAHYRPAGCLSGDYLDWVIYRDASGKRYLYLCLGDVMGKGTDAGLVVGVVYSVFNVAAGEGWPLDRIAKAVNERLVSLSGYFITIVFLRWNESERVMEYCPAGKHYWIYRRSTGQLESQDQEQNNVGIALGLKSSACYRTRQMQLAEDDVVVLASDGTWEAKDKAGRFLTTEGFESYLTRAVTTGTSAGEILADIVGRLAAFTEGTVKLHDDISVAVATKFGSSRTAGGKGDGDESGRR